MIERKMVVEGFPGPTIEFTPRSGADFAPVFISTPFLDSQEKEDEFRGQATTAIQKACGNTACRGRVLFSSAALTDFEGARTIIGAKITCDNETCPLIDPPEAGDREPRVPVGPLPSLEAEVPVTI